MVSRALAVAALALIACSIAPARASVFYDPGALGFASSGQSMWDTGTAFRKSADVFVGKTWTNKTAPIGGITGSANEVIVPGTPPIYAPFFDPGCFCWKQHLVYPGTNPVTADTRTGVKLDVHTSGKVGLGFGYSIDSGSVDATAKFDATATLPDTVSANTFFTIDTNSDFVHGTIKTQSPAAEAYFSAIMHLSGSIDAEACATFQGCETGHVPLPSVNLDQRILSIDPNSLKILDGILPGGVPLAQLPIANQKLTLKAGVSPAPPEVGFKLEPSVGPTIINTLPPVLSVTADLAEIELNVPDIATSGSGSAGAVTSSGDDDLLSATMDIDGAATIFAGMPPAGLNFTVIDRSPFKVEGSLDLIDVDAGPVLGLAQDFELVPTLMVNFDFSRPVQISGETGLQTSWMGPWSNLPQFAISQATTFKPTFWLDAMLRNNTGLDLGLVGTLNLLKLSAEGSIGNINLLRFGPLTLNNILGFSDDLFSTDTVDFLVYDKTFQLGGFNRIPGPSFAFAFDEAPVILPISGGGSNSVPAPPTLWLLLAGLFVLFAPSYLRRRESVIRRA